jgi:hypothetical protein
MAEVVRSPSRERLNELAGTLEKHLDQERVDVLGPMCERIDEQRRSVLAARYMQTIETASERRPGTGR